MMNRGDLYEAMIIGSGLGIAVVLLVAILVVVVMK
jgi:hypothetical protein